MTTEEQLTAFRERYRSVNVMVYDDLLVYKVSSQYFINDSVREANEIIKDLGLSLVAEGGGGLLSKTFTVKAMNNVAVGS